MPILFASDATQLSTHAGDHDCWPIYMSIGNLPSSYRARPSTNSWILVALLPMPPKKDDTLEKDDKGKPRCNLTAAEKEKYARFKDDCIHQVLQDILRDLREPMSTGILLECADGHYRVGIPKIAGWIADYQEYNKLYQTTKDGCAMCDISYHQLGDGVTGEKRDYDAHASEFLTWKEKRDRVLELAADSTRTKEYRKEKKELELLSLSFKARQSKTYDNSLFASRLVTPEVLWKPDLLHTLYQGMYNYIFEWLKKFLSAYGRYARWNQVFTRIPAFTGLPENKKPLGANSQKTGKLMRNSLRVLLPTLVIALDKPSKEEELPFKRCLTAVRYFVDFALVCQYKKHTATSIGYLERYLDRFHQFKDVFSPYRLEKQQQKRAAKKAADAAAQGNVGDEIDDGQSKEEEEALLRRAAKLKKKRQHTKYFGGLTRAIAEDPNLREQLGANADRILAEVESFNNEDADAMLDDQGLFRIIKLHLLSHFSDTISEFGALQQYSTEIGEVLHKGLKEAYRKTNKINIRPQILKYHTRRFAIRMRELNLYQLALDGLYQAEIQDVLQLYASAVDKNLAAKAYRDGIGSLVTGVAALSMQPEDDQEADEFKPKSTEPIAEVERMRVPVAKALFKAIDKKVMSRVLSAPVRSGSKNLKSLQTTVKIPGLIRATKAFLDQEPGYRDVNVTQEELQDSRMRTQLWSQLKITTPAIQSEEPFETLNVVCTSVFADRRGQNRKRNDAVLYRDSDSDDSDTEVQSSKAQNSNASGVRLKKQNTGSLATEKAMVESDFGPYGFGNLKCLFQLRLPAPEKFGTFRMTGFIPDRHYKTYHLAFVEVLIGEKDPVTGFEMQHGPEIAVCKLPSGYHGSVENVWSRDGGKVMDVSSIVRPAHLIPFHDSDSVPRAEKRWAVNNRIDIGTWDLIYGSVY